jgi:hypothetical protein
MNALRGRPNYEPSKVPNQIHSAILACSSFSGRVLESAGRMPALPGRPNYEPSEVLNQIHSAIKLRNLIAVTVE